jgi:hypothetical protein
MRNEEVNDAPRTRTQEELHLRLLPQERLAQETPPAPPALAAAIADDHYKEDELKTHAKHIATGGVVAPATLGLAALIANGVQEGIGLNLSGIGLAIYLAAFLIGSALVLHGQLRLEAQKVIAELGSGELDLGGLLGGLGGLLGSPPASTVDAAIAVPETSEARAEPPPPPPASVPPPPPPPAP